MWEITLVYDIFDYRGFRENSDFSLISYIMLSAYDKI